jgi:hypothetical protein
MNSLTDDKTHDDIQLEDVRKSYSGLYINKKQDVFKERVAICLTALLTVASIAMSIYNTTRTNSEICPCYQLDIFTAGIPGSSIIDNSILGKSIAPGTITGDKIMDSTISSNSLVTGSLLTTNLADSSITTSKLADNCVINSKIMDGVISGTKLQPSSVTSDKIMLSSINGYILTNFSIGTSKIMNGAITNSLMDPLAIKSLYSLTNMGKSYRIQKNVVINQSGLQNNGGTAQMINQVIGSYNTYIINLSLCSWSLAGGSQCELTEWKCIWNSNIGSCSKTYSYQDTNKQHTIQFTSGNWLSVVNEEPTSWDMLASVDMTQINYV